jgi:hypothetical protein
MYPGVVTDHIAEDRLAVLEKDHRAMERLRNEHIDLENDGTGLYNARKYTWTGERWEVISHCIKGDPADAILAEGE